MKNNPTDLQNRSFHEDRRTIILYLIAKNVLSASSPCRAGDQEPTESSTYLTLGPQSSQILTGQSLDSGIIRQSYVQL